MQSLIDANDSLDLVKRQNPPFVHSPYLGRFLGLKSELRRSELTKTGNRGFLGLGDDQHKVLNYCGGLVVRARVVVRSSRPRIR